MDFNLFLRIIILVFSVCFGEVPPTGEEAPPTPASTSSCPPSNCGEIQCPYGIEETFDAGGCSSCACSNPCEVQTCPEGSRCVVDVVRTSSAAVRTEPVCRRVQKSGTCPAEEGGGRPAEECERRCRDDADCRGEHKCCDSGCAFTCTAPLSSDGKFDETKRPEPATILPGVNVTRGVVGQPARLPCSVVGWPRPEVRWWRDNTMLPLSSSRYQQLPDHALLIRSVAHEDGGDYFCLAHNGVGTCAAYYGVTLVLDFSSHDPRLLNNVPPKFVTNMTNQYVDVLENCSVTLTCKATGKPPPEIKWRREDGRPFTIGGNEIREYINEELHFVGVDRLQRGPYICVASNEVPPAISRRIFLDVKFPHRTLRCRTSRGRRRYLARLALSAKPRVTLQTVTG